QEWPVPRSRADGRAQARPALGRGKGLIIRTAAPVPFDVPVYVTRPLLPPLESLMARLEDVWAAQHLTNMGPQHEQLEAALRSYLGVSQLSLFTNGTVALITAIRALGLKGEVLTTPF